MVGVRRPGIELEFFLYLDYTYMQVSNSSSIPNTKLHPEYKLPYCAELTGKTKSYFEIVITRFDENIDWSDNYILHRTIYNKGEENPNCDYIQRPNWGRDGETILYHIINNWDNLAEITFFCQGTLNDRKDQIINETDLLNYVKCNKLHIFKRVNAPPPHASYYKFKKNIGELYEELFNEKYNRNFRWCPGMWISVRREVIMNVPIEKYQKMLEMWHKYDDIINDKTGRRFGIYLERLLIPLFEKYNPSLKQA